LIVIVLIRDLQVFGGRIFGAAGFRGSCVCEAVAVPAAKVRSMISRSVKKATAG
jgi:hypothetical protein